MNNLPYYIDRWRIWPRAMITVYLWLVVETALWFMGIVDPTTQQAAFAGSVLGMFVGLFGVYVQEPAKPKEDD